MTCAVVKDERGGAAGAHFDARHAALHATLDAMFAATIGEQADDLAHAHEGTRETLAEERSPHHGELRDLDVILQGAAVEAGRQEEHVAQQRVAETFVKEGTGRAAMGFERGLIQSGDPGVQRAETIDRAGKLPGDVGQHGFEVVVQAQILARHRHA